MHYDYENPQERKRAHIAWAVSIFSLAAVWGIALVGWFLLWW